MTVSAASKALPAIPASPEEIQGALPEGWSLLGPKPAKRGGVVWEAQGPFGVASAPTPEALIAQLLAAIEINPLLRPSRSGRGVEKGDGFKINRRRRSARRKIEDGLFRCRSETCRALVYADKFLEHLSEQHGVTETDPERICSAYEDVEDVADIEEWTD